MGHSDCTKSWCVALALDKETIPLLACSRMEAEDFMHGWWLPSALPKPELLIDMKAIVSEPTTGL